MDNSKKNRKKDISVLAILILEVGNLLMLLEGCSTKWQSGNKLESGLWKWCVYNNGSQEWACSKWNQGAMEAAQAMICLGIVCNVLAVAAYTLWMMCHLKWKTYGGLALCSAFLSGTWIVIGLGIYTATDRYRDVAHGTSFWLCVGSAILHYLACIISLILLCHNFHKRRAARRPMTVPLDEMINRAFDALNQDLQRNTNVEGMLGQVSGAAMNTQHLKDPEMTEDSPPSYSKATGVWFIEDEVFVESVDSVHKQVPEGLSWNSLGSGYLRVSIPVPPTKEQN